MWLKRTEGALGIRNKGKRSLSYNLSGVYIHMHWKHQNLISLPKTRNRTCSNPKLIPDQLCHTQFKVSVIVTAEIVTAYDFAKTDA